MLLEEMKENVKKYLLKVHEFFTSYWYYMKYRLSDENQSINSPL